MDLAKQAKIVDSIHDTLHDFVGQRLKFGPIWVGRKSSRAKAFSCRCTRSCSSSRWIASAAAPPASPTQYVDVLTGMVELSQNGEPLFEPFVPESADGAPAADLMDEQEEEKVLS